LILPSLQHAARIFQLDFSPTRKVVVAAGRRGKTIQEARSMATRQDFRRWTEDPTLKGKRER
jgi:hypothetical protein